MIVRNATADDVAYVIRNLSPESHREYTVCARGRPLLELEAVLLAALPRAAVMLALVDDRTGLVGALMGGYRGEAQELRLAGCTTVHFHLIQRAFWIWAPRRFIGETVDRLAFRSTMSVMTGHPMWLAMLKKHGFREEGTSLVDGVVFHDLVRLRPSRLTRAGAA